MWRVKVNPLHDFCVKDENLKRFVGIQRVKAVKLARGWAREQKLKVTNDDVWDAAMDAWYLANVNPNSLVIKGGWYYD